jgi:hypothetical protein
MENMWAAIQIIFVMALPAPAPKAPEPEAIPPNERDLLKWAMEHSEDASRIRRDQLMTHEEFKEMWNGLCPDVLKQLRDGLALVRSNPDDEKMYEALDRLLFLVEDIDAADWFVDLEGYVDCFRLMESPNPEIRMAAAWIVANTLQNNPKDQQKFMDKFGLGPVFPLFERETAEKSAIRMFSLVSNAIRAFKPLKQQFYLLDGIRRLEAICARFPKLFFRLCWLTGAVLDETDPDDVAEFQRVGLKELLLQHADQINDEEILQSVVDRLQ